MIPLCLLDRLPVESFLGTLRLSKNGVAAKKRKGGRSLLLR